MGIFNALRNAGSTILNANALDVLDGAKKVVTAAVTQETLKKAANATFTVLEKTEKAVYAGVKGGFSITKAAIQAAKDSAEPEEAEFVVTEEKTK
jgi:hypothetical protein